MQDDRTRMIRRIVRHGAKVVPPSELMEASEIVWRIGPEDEVSETCIRLEEFSASATRNAQSALRVMDRMEGSVGLDDRDLLTALKKYVEDAGLAIKELDNTLRGKESSLESLLFEIPNEGSEDEVSWRSLIGRRDVIAHQLLTVDDERVYQEARRDFGRLSQLVSKVYFVPTKTDLKSRKWFPILMRTSALENLSPSTAGLRPDIGQCLIFIYEDKLGGFLSLRIGRSENNKITLASSYLPPAVSLSIDELVREFSLTGIEERDEGRGA